MIPVLEAIVFAVIVVLVLFSLYCRTRGCAVEDITVKRAPDIEINVSTIVPLASTRSPNLEARSPNLEVIQQLRSYPGSRKTREFTAEEIERIRLIASETTLELEAETEAKRKTEEQDNNVLERQDMNVVRAIESAHWHRYE